MKKLVLKKLLLLSLVGLMVFSFATMVYAQGSQAPVAKAGFVMPQTGLRIKALHTGDIMVQWAFVLTGWNPGRYTFGPVNVFLILGAEKPILVDTGMPAGYEFRGPLKAFTTPEQDLVKLLKAEGLEPGNIGYIIHTHLDVDHAGKDELFPNAKIIIQKKEMAAKTTGYGGNPTLPWLVANLHRIEFIDGDEELFPGVKCVLAPGHSQGHQHVEVQTSAGKAILVGDSIYDVPMQLEERIPRRDFLLGNYWDRAGAMEQQAKLKKELRKGTMILPVHDYIVYDRYKIGKKLTDYRNNYDGYPTMDWPQKQ
jgi:glyoxylase-like metal-dependent hydrolase (beta-lactamase superfamily II)